MDTIADSGLTNQRSELPRKSCTSAGLLPRSMTGRSETPSFSPKKWVCIRSTHSQAAGRLRKFKVPELGHLSLLAGRITERYFNWQWNEVLIPYWKKDSRVRKGNSVNKIAFELHRDSAFTIPDSMKKIREAVGPELGANLDPSHLIWQGMDPLRSYQNLATRSSTSMQRTPVLTSTIPL